MSSIWIDVNEEQWKDCGVLQQGWYSHKCDERMRWEDFLSDNCWENLENPKQKVWPHCGGYRRIEENWRARGPRTPSMFGSAWTTFERTRIRPT